MANETRSTEPFRQEHVAIREHLGHMSEMIGALTGCRQDERKQIMERLVKALRTHIVPHAEWEEEVLYPVVDGRAGGGEFPFTAAMRHEHAIVGRWLATLATEAAKLEPDVRAFSRQADQLLGLILAHFEDEEEVLLPVLDRTMTVEEFEREIVAKGGHPHAH